MWRDNDYLEKHKLFYIARIEFTRTFFVLFSQIPIYKGATEAIIPAEIKVGTFRGLNGFSDVEVWQPHYPNDVNALIQKENAVEIIRNLVMEVCI